MVEFVGSVFIGFGFVVVVFGGFSRVCCVLCFLRLFFLSIGRGFGLLCFFGFFGVLGWWFFLCVGCLFGWLLFGFCWCGGLVCVCWFLGFFWFVSLRGFWGWFFGVFLLCVGACGCSGVFVVGWWVVFCVGVGCYCRLFGL